MLKSILLVLLLAFIMATAARAQDDRYPPKPDYGFTQKRVKIHTRHSRWIHTRHTLWAGLTAELGKAVVGGRPAGCPARFCGCALAIRLFGRQVPGLNLAANWLRFPAATPAPGMVGARPGHVLQLLAHRQPHPRCAAPCWQVWDPNSGGGRIHIHDRTISDYRIVNPTKS